MTTDQVAGAAPAPATPVDLAPAEVHRAMVATYVAFVGAGLAMATWAAQIPQVRDRLGLQPSALGLVLLALAAGSLVALPLSGPLIARIGSRRVVAGASVVAGAAMAGVAGGHLVGVAPVVVGLFVFGLAAAAWDVAMNVHGAFVEQQLGRTVMSRFHAGFSLGTVAGALLGAGAVALGLPVAAHLAVTGVGVALVVALGTRGFLSGRSGDGGGLPDAEPVGASSRASTPRSAFASWREPRTLLVGLFVLTFAFAEGVGNDWIAVAVVDGHGATPAVGALAFATFLAAMTVGRWFGPALLDRYGRVAVVRTLAALGIVGTLVFVLAPSPLPAFVGASLWGLGASLGFPVGMSAGADEPALAAGRVSVVSSIGYCAFLAGPPLIGFLGDHLTVLRALASVTVLLAVAVLIAPAVARPVTD